MEQKRGEQKNRKELGIECTFGGLVVGPTAAALRCRLRSGIEEFEESSESFAHFNLDTKTRLPGGKLRDSQVGTMYKI